MPLALAFVLTCVAMVCFGAAMGHFGGWLAVRLFESQSAHDKGMMIIVVLVSIATYWAFEALEAHYGY